MMMRKDDNHQTSLALYAYNACNTSVGNCVCWKSYDLWKTPTLATQWLNLLYLPQSSPTPSRRQYKFTQLTFKLWIGQHDLVIKQQLKVSFDSIKQKFVCWCCSVLKRDNKKSNKNDVTAAFMPALSGYSQQRFSCFFLAWHCYDALITTRPKNNASHTEKKKKTEAIVLWLIFLSHPIIHFVVCIKKKFVVVFDCCSSPGRWYQICSFFFLDVWAYHEEHEQFVLKLYQQWMGNWIW